MRFVVAMTGLDSPQASNSLSDILGLGCGVVAKVGFKVCAPPLVLCFLVHFSPETICSLQLSQLYSTVIFTQPLFALTLGGRYLLVQLGPFKTLLPLFLL